MWNPWRVELGNPLTPLQLSTLLRSEIPRFLFILRSRRWPFYSRRELRGPYRIACGLTDDVSPLPLRAASSRFPASARRRFLCRCFHSHDAGYEGAPDQWLRRELRDWKDDDSDRLSDLRELFIFSVNERVRCRTAFSEGKTCCLYAPFLSCLYRSVSFDWMRSKSSVTAISWAACCRSMTAVLLFVENLLPARVCVLYPLNFSSVLCGICYCLLGYY